jgi:hypothetical protein
VKALIWSLLFHGFYFSDGIYTTRLFAFVSHYFLSFHISLHPHALQVFRTNTGAIEPGQTSLGFSIISKRPVSCLVICMLPGYPFFPLSSPLVGCMREKGQKEGFISFIPLVMFSIVSLLCGLLDYPLAALFGSGVGVGHCCFGLDWNEG